MQGIATHPQYVFEPMGGFGGSLVFIDIAI